VVYGRFDSRFDSNGKNDSQVPTHHVTMTHWEKSVTCVCEVGRRGLCPPSPVEHRRPLSQTDPAAETFTTKHQQQTLSASSTAACQLQDCSTLIGHSLVTSRAVCQLVTDIRVRQLRSADARTLVVSHILSSFSDRTLLLFCSWNRCQGTQRVMWTVQAFTRHLWG